MLDSSDQQRLHKLLSDTIPLLCKRTLGYSLELSVEAFIGITLSGENASKEMVMVSFKETLLADGRVSSYVWSEVPSSGTDLQSPLVEPVAFNVSESGNRGDTSSTMDGFYGNDRGLERHGEYDPNWDNGKYWSECSESDINGGTSFSTRDADKGATGTSAYTHLPSFPVKMEESDNVNKIGDDCEDIETDADLENASDIGNSYGSSYTSVVRHYSLATGPRGNVNIHPRYLSTASQSLRKFNAGPRRMTCQPGSSSMRALSFHSFPSSPRSKQRVQMKKTLPAVNTAMQSSHSEVTKLYI